jgi:phosphatidylinositol glycan class O
MNMTVFFYESRPTHTLFFFLSNEQSDLEGCKSTSWLRTVSFALLSSVFFFATGHQASFVALHWESAFVFGPLSNNLVSGLAVLVNTYAVHVVAAFALPCLAVTNANSPDRTGLGERLFGVGSVFLAFFQLRLFGCAVAAAALKRHLMVWKIFGPRFLFDFVGFFVVAVTTVIAFVTGNFVSSFVRESPTRLERAKLP